jgi:OHCU decarboxylase
VNGTSAILVEFPTNVQAFLNSGITMGSITAILLNLMLNYFGGEQHDGTGIRERVTVQQLNAMEREKFVATVAPAYQGDAGIAQSVAARRPFENGYALRVTLQDELFSLPEDRQYALMRSYPSLAGEDLLAGDLGEYSVLDQASAGLTFLSESEQDAFNEVTRAYQEKFGFPLIVAARELSSEQVLEQAWQRLDNSATQEHVAALLEIAKIANHRLEDAVEDTTPRGSILAASMARLH